MHPTHLDVLATLLASVRPGSPWADRSGLSVVPLRSREPPAAAAPASLRRCRDVEIAEHTPPRAGAIAVRVRDGRAVVARMGDIVAGGMSDRAIARTTAIGGGGAVEVPVMALESRWWPGGAFVARGALPASLLTLVALATLGGDAVARATAQTALWSAGAGGARGVERRVRGFVLLAGDRAVAVYVSSGDVSVAVGAAVGGDRWSGDGDGGVRPVIRALIDRPGAMVSVASTAPPLVEAWVIEPGCLP